MFTQYLTMRGGQQEQYKKKKSGLIKSGTKRFKEDDIQNSDDLMSSVSSNSKARHKTGDSKKKNAHAQNRPEIQYKEEFQDINNEDDKNYLSVAGSRQGSRQHPKRNHSQGKVSNTVGPFEGETFLSVAQINDQLNEQDEEEKKKALDNSTDKKKRGKQSEGLRRASSVEFKNLDLNQLRKQFQSHLIVEDLELKNGGKAHDAKSLISHIEQMLNNPMQSSPLFKKNDSLRSNNSKNSKHSKHSGAQKDITKQSINLDASIDNANLKLMAREFTLRAGEKLGLKSQPTFKKMIQRDQMKPTLATRIGDGLVGSFLKIPGASPMDQLRPNKKFLMDEEKKNSGYQLSSINLDTEDLNESKNSNNIDKIKHLGGGSYLNNPWEKYKQENRRSIIQDSSHELSVIVKHSELDDDENINISLKQMDKRQSVHENFPQIEIIGQTTPVSSAQKLLEIPANMDTPLHSIEKKELDQHQPFSKDVTLVPSLVQEDQQRTKNSEFNFQKSQAKNEIEESQQQKNKVSNFRRFSKMQPEQSKIKKSGTHKQNINLVNDLKRKTDSSALSLGKSQGILKAGTIMANTILSHQNSDHDKINTSLSGTDGARFLETKRGSILPQQNFLHIGINNQNSILTNQGIKKANESYYKIENMEALKADPRQWIAGDTFFTPWDIARLNHLYASGKKNQGQQQVEQENTYDESLKHKLRRKLAKCLNLEPPSDEEGGLDEIQEIKAPRFSSGESEEDEAQEVSYKNMGKEEKRARMIDLWRRLSVKALGGARIIIRFQELSENITMFGASRRVAVDIEEEIQPLPFILLPDNKFRMAWNVVTMVLLLYTASFVPYRTSFIEDAPKSLIAWEWVVDALFVIDIFINFISAYENSDKNLEVRLKEIARSYIFTWFPFDLAAVFPFQLLESSSEATYQSDLALTDTQLVGDQLQMSNIIRRREESDSQNINRLIRLARLPRLYRLMRILRLFKIFSLLKNNASFKKLQEAVNMNVGVQRMIIIALVVVFTVHLMACLFFLVSKFEDEDQDNWVVYSGIQDESPAYQYLVSVYWALQTLTTVGYGDITPRSVYEKIAGLIWMIIGVGFYSFTIGNLASIFKQIDIKAAHLQQKLQILADYSKRNKIPDEVQNKVKIFIENNHGDHLSLNDQKNLLAEVPASMRVEVVSHTHAKIIERIRFFKQKDPAFLFAILPLLKPMKVYAKDQLYCQGDYAEEIFFIFEGRIKLHTDLNDNHDGEPILVPFNLYIQGSYFGDSDIFVENQRNIRDSTAVAEVRSELLVITRLELQRILERFKKIDKEMRLIAHERKKHHKKAIYNTIDKNQHRILDLKQDQQAKSLPKEKLEDEGGNMLQKIMGSFGKDIRENNQENDEDEGVSARNQRGKSQFKRSKLRLKVNQRQSIVSNQVGDRPSSRGPDMKREILQVIQLMKTNNVLPNQVSSTIKHILDVKEEVGGGLTELVSRRRGGIMMNTPEAVQAADNFLLEGNEPVRTSHDTLDSKHKKKVKATNKENNAMKSETEEDSHTEQAQQEYVSLPVTKMPYGLKPKGVTTFNPQEFDIKEQQQNSLPPVLSRTQAAFSDDIVQEATSEEEEDSSDSSQRDRRRQDRRKKKSAVTVDRPQDLAAALYAAENMLDDVQWDFANQEILQGFQENMALIAANSFEILQLYEMINKDYAKVTQRIKNAETHVSQIQNRTQELEVKLTRLLPLVD